LLNEKKLKPQPGWSFKGMTWLYKVYGLIHNIQRNLEKIPVKEGMVIVDYGCGPGRYTIPMAKLVGPKGKVFAVDLHPLAIKMIKEKAAHESLTNVEAVLVDSYNTGIQSSTIDLILLIDTLPLVKDYNALLGEIYRLLKPNGLMFISHARIKVSRTKEIVENTGLFTIVECRGHDMLVAPKAKQ
jgi:ubiquinone/menaquinone biosynthesis C-methylase UbiE